MSLCRRLGGLCPDRVSREVLADTSGRSRKLQCYGTRKMGWDVSTKLSLCECFYCHYVNFYLNYYMNVKMFLLELSLCE